MQKFFFSLLTISRARNDGAHKNGESHAPNHEKMNR